MMLQRSIYQSFPHLLHAFGFFGLALILVFQTGCQRQDEIVRYQVDRPAPPHRMLAAIVPHAGKDWFFKVTGANSAVAEHADGFSQLIESIQFSEGDDPEPTWKLPEGWSEQPGSGMRHATIMIPTDEQELELTVIPLPQQASASTLANVNRWRGQLGLVPLDESNLESETTSVEVAGAAATLVNLVGKSGASAPMAPPAMSRGAADPEQARIEAHAAAGIEEPGTSEASESAPRNAPPSSITYKAPSGWKPGRRAASNSPFAIPREAAFEVEDDGRSAEITVTALGAGASDLLPNVNRWRGQVGLEPFTAEELEKEAKTIDMNGTEGKYFRLIGPQQAILGVIADRGEKVWFVKLQGNHDLAVKLQEDFEAFARSIKF